jgi:capsule polysaccharide modification protein KpsS
MFQSQSKALEQSWRVSETLPLPFFVHVTLIQVASLVTVPVKVLGLFQYDLTLLTSFAISVAPNQCSFWHPQEKAEAEAAMYATEATAIEMNFIFVGR